MDRIGHVLRIFIEALLVLLLMLGCVRLCTGCALVERAAPKERVAEIVRTAYAEGGRAAVSNRIETLVADGKITPEQALQLHALAQGVYERIIERLDKEIGVEDECGDACSEPECTPQE